MQPHPHSRSREASESVAGVMNLPATSTFPSSRRLHRAYACAGRNMRNEKRLRYILVHGDGWLVKREQKISRQLFKRLDLINAVIIRTYKL
jgi:hypothetical protein